MSWPGLTTCLDSAAQQPREPHVAGQPNLDVAARSAAPRREDGRTIILGAALLLVVLIIGTTMLLLRTQESAVRTARTSLQNVAAIVESSLNRQLLQVDGALVSMPSLFSLVSSTNHPINAASASRVLRGFNFQTFLFRDLLLARPDGTIVAQARPGMPDGKLPVMISQLQANSRPGAVAIVGPVRNPATGDFSLFLARPINLPDLGPLDAIAEVPLPLLAGLLSAVGEIPGLHIAVMRPDGQVLANIPHDEPAPGQEQALKLGSGVPNGTAFTIPAGPSNPATMVVLRRTLYPDVVVCLTIRTDVALSELARERNRLLIVALSLAAMVVAFATALYVAAWQQRKVELERARSSQTLENALESMADGFVMWDKDDRLITCNRLYREMYSVSGDFIRPGAHFADIVREGVRRGQYPGVAADDEQFVQDTMRWHRGNNGSIERELPNGRWALITERRMPDNGIVGIRTDITELKTAQNDLAAANARVERVIADLQFQNMRLQERDQSLRQQNVLFEAALNNMSHGLLMADSEQRLIVWNRRFVDLFGLTGIAARPGSSISDVFQTIEHAGALEPELVRRIFIQQQALAAMGQSGTFTTAGDSVPVLSISHRPMADGGWVAIYEDVTEQQTAAQQIRYIAHHDTLTKLPNRLMFRTRIEEALKARSVDGEGLALLYLDLDNFKDVNDTLGHPAGDALLEAAGRRLVTCLRSSDFVARLGGDEFAIIYRSWDMPRMAKDLGERVIEALSAPYELMGRTVTVGASVGLAVAESPKIDADTLLKNADMALYQAKATGRGTCCLFEADMGARLHARIALEQDLREALQGDQLELLYQPLYDLRTERISGFEALLRWNHPTRGLVMPMKFITMAEEIGAIHAIGAWVLRQACMDAALLPPDVKVAVNLSPTQLRNDEIVRHVSAALQASGLRPSRLELEITETALLKNSEATITLLHRLHDLGIHIALDDFGTGYSSLSYLRSFPFDKIKIDQSFVKEMERRHDCAAIVSSVASLAKKLSMTTTAEGVETLDQLDKIREVGCTEAQGYLFGVPRPIHDVLDFFHDRKAGRDGWTIEGSASLIATG
jgi:diguanylate cyclase (GGDEF)-like protein